MNTAFEPLFSKLTSKDLRDLIESGGRLVVTAIGLAYAAGLLITNLYIGSLGFPPPDLAQPRYVVVGSLWIFLTGLVATLVGVATHTIREALHRWRRGFRIQALFEFALAFGMVVVGGLVLCLVSQFNLALNEKSTWVIFALLAWTAFGCRPMMQSAIELLTSLGQADREEPLNAYMNVYGVLMHTLVLLLFIAGYALIAYPLIPSAFGGGRGRSVLFLPGKDGAAQLARLGLLQRKDGLFGPVTIIQEDEQSCYITITSPKKPQCIRVSKTLIDGAINVVPTVTVEHFRAN